MKELKPCGTLAAYRRHLARFEIPCELCSAARLDYERKRRESYVPKIAIPCEALKHGTRVAYCCYGCRCPESRAAQAEYSRRLNRDRMLGIPRTVSRFGTQRRLRALAAIGWDMRTLSKMTGRTEWALSDTLQQCGQIRADIAERVIDLYERLCMSPGPSRISEARARAKGWDPPAAWDSETIDDPAALPAEWQRPKRVLNKSVDVAEDARELIDKHGETYEMAAKRLGISEISLFQALRRANGTRLPVTESAASAKRSAK